MVVGAARDSNVPEMERSSMAIHKPSEDIKQINVSEKRQVTIPKLFYDKLEMGHEIMCELRGDEIVLRKAPQEEDFSEEILKDLVNQGFEGQDLVHEFQKMKSQMRPAIERMIEESYVAAQNLDDQGDEQTEELFGDLRED